MLQQTLLLFLVEGLDLVQIEQNAIGRHEGIQLGHDLLDVRRGSGGGVELIEGAVRLLGDDVGDSGLAGAAGTIEDHVGDLAGIDEPPQHGALSQNVLLSKHIIQSLRPQQVGQWLIHTQPPFVFSTVYHILLCESMPKKERATPAPLI